MKTTSIYSFGVDSPLKFEMSDKFAKLYNEAVAEFFKAQQRFNQKVGREWNPETDPISLKWNSKQQKAWDDFSKLIKEVVKRDGPFHENDIMEDFLIKNAGSAAVTAIGGFHRAITIAVTLGAVYGLLRGRTGPS